MTKTTQLHSLLTGVLIIILGFALLPLAALGCRESGAPSTVTVVVTQTTQTQATTGELALGKTLTLEPDTKKESSASPPYDISVRKPVLKGSDDPRVGTFNQSVGSLIDQQISDFKQQAAQTYGEPTPGTGSTLSIDYTLKSPPGQIISIVIKSDAYYAGAAHPGHTFQTINYDLSTGKVLKFSQLFTPGAAYLDALATFCSQELTKRDALSFPEGAAPTEENYKNWAMTADGLEIIFEEYQVAPYAMGPQTVLVPYTYLQKLLDPKGPVSKVKQ